MFGWKYKSRVLPSKHSSLYTWTIINISLLFLTYNSTSISLETEVSWKLFLAVCKVLLWDKHVKLCMPTWLAFFTYPVTYVCMHISYTMQLWILFASYIISHSFDLWVWPPCFQERRCSNFDCIISYACMYTNNIFMQVTVCRIYFKISVRPQKGGRVNI